MNIAQKYTIPLAITDFNDRLVHITQENPACACDSPTCIEYDSIPQVIAALQDLYNQKKKPKMDTISLDRIKRMHPKLRAETLAIFTEACEAVAGRAIPRLSYTLRTFTEQDALYAQGRGGDKRPIVTNARGGQSAHNYGLAVDIVLLKDTDGNGTYDTASWETNVDFDGDGKADWMEIVAIFKKYGWTWGGDFTSIKDKPHFEKTFGHSITYLQALKADKKLDKEGYVLI